MSQVIKLKKGLDIRLQGKPEEKLAVANRSATYAIKPTDFPGLTPKLAVKAGHEVKVGSSLFFDKYRPDVIFSSPVSGKVIAVNRGERRRILEVVVEPDAEMKYEEFTKGNPAEMTREDIVANLLKSGMWPALRQRPYAVIANPEDKPKAVFVSTFDSAPMAPDYQFVIKENLDAFQLGINALSRLTDGKVHLGLNGAISNNIFDSVKGAELHYFTGPHPAGVEGIQIHHIDPVNKGEVVWYMSPQNVVAVGKLFETGKLHTERVVALTGSEVEAPQYYKTHLGTAMAALVDGKLKPGTNRIVSGSVLSGEKVGTKSYLGFYDSQIAVLPEGNQPEFLGWGTPGFDKFSMSRTFFSWLNSKEYKLDTNMHGGHRPFVVTGEYEKVVPMDILPVHLLKSIIIDDIDKMEQLGIYEVAEEDFALCEFVCTSKTPVQAILRKGIDTMIKEFS